MESKRGTEKSTDELIEELTPKIGKFFYKKNKDPKRPIEKIVFIEKINEQGSIWIKTLEPQYIRGKFFRYLIYAIAGSIEYAEEYLRNTKEITPESIEEYLGTITIPSKKERRSKLERPERQTTKETIYKIQSFVRKALESLENPE